jgi:hypothetical protein
MTLIPDLERDLLAAASRVRARRMRRRVGLILVSAAGGLLVLLAFVLGNSADPLDRSRPSDGENSSTAHRAPAVGSVIPEGAGKPPREGDHIVVATGRSPVAGRWQLEHYRSTRLADPQTGEVYQPAGLPCLGIALLDPSTEVPVLASGQCGEFPRTPGFGRVQMSVPQVRGKVRELLVYGRTPERTRSVVLTAAGGVKITVDPFEGPRSVAGDFYLIAVSPDLEDGRVNWVDEHGNVGGPGLELLPP